MIARLLFLGILAAGCSSRSIKDTFSIEGDWYCRFDFFEDAGRWRLDQLVTFTQDSVLLHPGIERRALAYNFNHEAGLLILQSEYQEGWDTLYIMKGGRDTLRFRVSPNHSLSMCEPGDSEESEVSRIRADTSLHIVRIGLASRGCNSAPACPRYAFEINQDGHVRFDGIEYAVVDGARKANGQEKLFDRLSTLGQSLNIRDEVRWDSSHDQYYGLVVYTSDAAYRLRGPYHNYGALTSLIDEIETSLATIPWEWAVAGQSFEALDYVKEPAVM